MVSSLRIGVNALTVLLHCCFLFFFVKETHFLFKTNLPEWFVGFIWFDLGLAN